MGALYQDFQEIPAPERFARTVQAYYRMIVASVPSYSMRRMCQEANASHNLLPQIIKSSSGKGKPITPRVQTVVALVSVINRHIADDQQWPVQVALEAAGHMPTITDDTIPYADVIDVSAQRMGARNSAIGLPMYRADTLGKYSLEESRYGSAYMWFGDGMAILVGKVPGWPYQLDPEHDMTLIRDTRVIPVDDVYALVRKDGAIRALPKELALRNPELIVCWLLAVVSVQMIPATVNREYAIPV